MSLRSKSKDGAAAEAKIEDVKWKPGETALIICDMWDDHWCKSASRRVAEMAPALNETMKAARAKGVFIIHAPSSVVGFYKGTAQCELAKRAPFAKAPIELSSAPRWGTSWCWTDPKYEGVLPIDDSDMGCSGRSEILGEQDRGGEHEARQTGVDDTRLQAPTADAQRDRIS